jgi:alkylhydroperoxidase family enzyme
LASERAPAAQVPCAAAREAIGVARIDVPAGDGDEVTRLFLMRPELSGAAGKLAEAVYHKSLISTREREVARMRIAQINQCPI